ncbi:MAG: CerR family C-terminal domain-containing protein [Deltaproteobacteria bacterium]|nr:CerR family C-terminal domain-containing protein [Deltaproteobacteria bacterium]MBW1942578.1 CerR family C-terminal domain-containing protein [Deltaproteobacteria bacterium]
MNQKEKNDFPKERILNEAEILFAQRGYHAVSIREITNAAQCNLAAVNYHFGNKENLYLEVFRARWMPRARRVIDCFDKTLASQDSLSPRAVIQALTKAFLEGPLSDEERQRHHLLMARELAQPTKALELVAEQIMGPFFQKLADKLRVFMPENLGEECLKLNILSVFAVVLYFNFARVAVTRITGREYDPDFKARLMEQIIQFSLKGLGGSEKGDLR